MTIVASNSITVSNINDGTITHYAYAYSADGTDRFTTVYPNLNLLNFKSGLKIGQNLSWTDGLTLLPNPARAIFDYISVIPGTTYTINSNWDKTERIAIFAYDSNDTKNATFIYEGISSKWFPPSTIGRAITQKTTLSIPDGVNFIRVVIFNKDISATLTLKDILDAKPKVEPGSTATPWMPSSSEVTTADWPSYIGQYSDFTSTASTYPAKYAPWTVFKGNDGVGIKTTVITYAISISGTIAPTTGWTSSVPSLVKGLYLWTKTVWTYTDNSSETGYSVTYISKDGNNGNDGIAGKDGVGILTTTITYAGSTSGTTAPTSGWSTTVPTVEAGSYLWTKTVWAYTDNTSETGYSVAKMGNTGPTGPAGAPGTNGAPGKIVSDTEPTTRFKGLTWKYSGASDLTASDGTVIKPNTEYYYNGTNWMINYLSANNLEANSITADLIDAKNLTITDGEFVSTTTNGQVSISTEIKDNHIIISKTDGTVNTRNDIALDSEQGLAQKFTNINTGFYRLAGINFQGPFISDSDGNYAQLTPRGTDLSTDVPWTNLTLASGFSIGSGGKARYRVKNGVLYIHFRKIVCPAITGNQPNTLCYVPANGRASDGYDSFGVMSATNSTRIQYNDSGDGKVAIVPASNTTSGQGFNGFLICPMD